MGRYTYLGNRGVLSVLLVGAALDYTQIAFHSWNGGVSPFWWRWGMDAATLSMALVFTLATIFLTAFLPAWRASRQDINETLRDGTRGAQSKRAGKLSRILVSCQVFLVTTLILIGSVAAIISHKMINIETGDDYTHVMNARVHIPEHKYLEPKQQLGVIQDLLQRVEQNPNVTGVISSSWFLEQSKVRVSNQQDVSELTHIMMDTMAVIGDTATIGINLVTGRALDNRDSLSSRKTVLISQSMANRYWPGESVLEKTLEIEIDGTFETFYIVGVVTNRINIRNLFGALDSADEIYLSGLQVISPLHFLYYRTEAGTVDADEIFYQALFDVDRTIEMKDPVEPADRNRNKLREMMQLVALVTYGTGAFALLLAIVGIYGITANAVAHRTHEIGIRRAVGANDKNIILMFLKQGARQLYTGVGLALVLFALVSFGFHRFTEALFPISLYFVIVAPVVIGLTMIVGLAILAPSATSRGNGTEYRLAL